MWSRVTLRVKTTAGIETGDHTALCVCDGLHQQLERGCGLGGLCIRVPATGQTGIQEQLLRRTSV